MLHSFPTTTLAAGKQGLPRRTDSLAPGMAPIFSELEDELRDVRRVNAQGQEEDLKMALSRMISRVEELSSLLKDAYKIQTDLQTELTLAKSNLQLALANNEMLEDALKRDVPGSSKDVGWRRWSAKEQKERELQDMKRRSVDEIGSPGPSSPSINSPPMSSTPSDSRFFRFRFGSASVSTSHFPISPRPSSPVVHSPGPGYAHLTSASLPSLVPLKEKEMEDLTAELEEERKAHKKAVEAKTALEAELEQLSQALFEEANKMVAEERMKLADTIEELKEAQLEKEALRSALRLVEKQSLPVSETTSDLPSRSETPSISSMPLHLERTHSRQVSASSAMGVKSLPSSTPSSRPSSRASSILLPPPPPPPPLVNAGRPAPLDLDSPEPSPEFSAFHTAATSSSRQYDSATPSEDKPFLSSTSVDSGSTLSPLPTKSSTLSSISSVLSTASVSTTSTVNASSSFSSSTLAVPPLSASAPPSLTPTVPTPGPPSPFTLPSPKSMVFYEEAESPWADAKSVSI
ncbi:hypothetical protein C8Q75DRAFT_778354 [Abortiporus biennis]|nr:hypothetical protein C8Q75DRAFT_778354 [Abortiporus biennis]